MDKYRERDFLMAYAAEIDSDNIVVRVLAFDDSLEPTVEEFATELLGGTWIQTSFNARIRKNYAGIGYKYDATRDAFIPPACHDDAVLDESTCLWTCTNSDHDDRISE